MDIIKNLIELHTLAATKIPADVKQAVDIAAREETHELSQFTLQQICRNFKIAADEKRAMCGDTGLPRYYVKIGNEANFPGGIVALMNQMKKAIALATAEIPLRSNYVDPLSRHDNGDNTGLFAPDIIFSYEPDAEWIDITTVHKGGLFGSDYRMLFPSDGIAGIKKFFLETSLAFLRRGLSCQPVIVGIGLGGTKDRCFSLGKEAACLRLIGQRHPESEVAELEQELLTLAEDIAIGPMGCEGIGGKAILDIHIEKAYNHTGGMPVSIHHFCFSARRATLRLYPATGAVEFREDPYWFSNFYRGINTELHQEKAYGTV
jgi:L(+)-tartrate dehydratase alpha subunit